jgi:p-aminobenzoyl-glutamate transporter AbgT
MGKAMQTMGTYMVLVFFAAQFVAYFRWTNLGLILAIRGAELLQASGLGPIPLLTAFILLTAVINLVMGSASAKWAIMAPIFIPMFMLLGYSPELVQAAYRIGDSTTNIISPMMSYFALIVAFFERYEPRAGIGTVVATMLPYTVAFMVIWIACWPSGCCSACRWGRGPVVPGVVRWMCSQAGSLCYRMAISLAQETRISLRHRPVSVGLRRACPLWI